jgi:hypothetical protein
MKEKFTYRGKTEILIPGASAWVVCFGLEGIELFVV